MQTTLDHPLHWVLLGLSDSAKGRFSSASAELVYGSPLVLPGQFQNMEDALVPKEGAPIVDKGPAADQAPYFNTAGRKSA